MEAQRAKILLEKINALYRSIDLDNGQLASIERDLMLSYIRQLYELFLSSAQGDAGAASFAEPPFETVDPVTRERRPQPEPLKRTYKPPRIIEIPTEQPETPAAKQTPPPSSPRPVETRRPEPQTAQPEPPAPKPQSFAKANPELEALFEQRRATELSEKLSESPITDLARAMAINDRLLFMNELFGRNMNTLDDTLRQLNRLSSMTEAKPLLLELGERYNWTDEEKVDTAKAFIKLVRRRYHNG